MLWRFAVIKPTGEYIKGDDYAQSTVLDFRLQEFLQRIYHNLPNNNNKSNLKAFTWQQYLDQSDRPGDVEEPHELMGVEKIINLRHIFKKTLGIRGNYGSCGAEITKEQIAFGASALETAYNIVLHSDKHIFDIQKNDEKYTMRGEEEVRKWSFAEDGELGNGTRAKVQFETYADGNGVRLNGIAVTELIERTSEPSEDDMIFAAAG